jgi:phosphoribosylaminoimidazolecarboxamide formyltransferase/IMP cyclohydrolase
MTKKALISVSDKTGIVEFARALIQSGFRILSTGGTAKLWGQGSSHGGRDYTGFPEMLDGRVKTLNPRIHAGLLARRPDVAHESALAEHGIEPIDMLVVNLYPFEQTIAKPGCSFDDAIENIDIGGPAMLRAAAKNHASVTVVVDPADYAAIGSELQQVDGISAATRLALARKVFAHTAHYDGAIANYLTGLDEQGVRGAFPDVLTRQWVKVQQMRYGENPHQQAAFYRDRHGAEGIGAGSRRVHTTAGQGTLVQQHRRCGRCVGMRAQLRGDGVRHRQACEPLRSRGGVRSRRRVCEGAEDRPDVGVRGNHRVQPGDRRCDRWGNCAHVRRSRHRTGVQRRGAHRLRLQAERAVLTVPPACHNDYDFKRVGGGLLVQTPDMHSLQPSELRVVTKLAPTPPQLADLMFAWRVAKYVKSNTIVFAKDGMTLGVGAGQMSRIDSARIASIKAKEAGLSLAGSAVASDAFFPFRDGLDVVVDAGATCVIQPGGSVRDEEVIAAANERGVAMVFTGVRHFRH